MQNLFLANEMTANTSASHLWDVETVNAPSPIDVELEDTQLMKTTVTH